MMLSQIKLVNLVGMLLLAILICMMSACTPNIDRLIEKGDIGGLIEASNIEDNSEIREQAVKALAEFESPDVVYALIDALNDDVTEVRAAAVYALGELDDPNSYDDIITALEDEQVSVRDEAKKTLIALGESVFDALISNLDTNDNELRQELISILDEIGQPASASLIEALSSQNENIKSGVYETLVDLGEPIIQDLIDALSEEGQERSQIIADILVELDDLSAPYLVDILDQPDEFVHERAVDALTRIGQPSVQPLVDSLSDPNLQEVSSDLLLAMGDLAMTGLIDAYQEDPNKADKILMLLSHGLVTDDEKIADQVTDILIEEGGRVVPFILDVYKEYTTVSQENVKLALIAIGEPAIPYLIDTLQEGKMTSLAKDVMVAIDTPELQNTTINALADPSPTVREQAAYTLGYLQVIDAIPSLIEVLNDEDRDVVDAAQFALGNIGMPAVDALLASYKNADEKMKTSITPILEKNYSTREDEILEIARKVCAGEAFTDASDYSRNSEESHPYVILYSDGDKHPWMEAIPIDWLPYTPEQLQVVVCLDEEPQEVQACGYYKYSESEKYSYRVREYITKTRYRYKMLAIVKEAVTGWEKSRTTLFGSEPPTCPSRTSSYAPIYGGHVNISDLSTWLSGFNIIFGN